jgi:hypothetical protein
MEATISGVDPKQYQYTEYARNRLDRISGLTATVQGNVGAADTATEAQIADTHFKDRTGYLTRRIKLAHEENLYNIAWYMFNTRGIAIPVNRRDAYSGELVEGMFFGGPSPGQMGVTWDDFNLTIKLNTLQREATAAANMERWYQLFMDVMTRAVQMPWLRPLNILRDIESTLGMEGKTDDWVIAEIFGGTAQPPLFPPSQVLGSRPVPARGGYPLVGRGARQPALQGPQGQGPNNFGAAPAGGMAGTRQGITPGPRPQQTQNLVA